MPDRDVYERAKAELVECEARAERAKAELAECEPRADRLRIFIATYEELAQGKAPSVTVTEAPRVSIGGRGALAAPVALGGVGRADTLRPYDYGAATPLDEGDDIVSAVIRDAGKPVKRMALFEAAKARGLVIVGKNPLNAFTTRVHRSKRFVSVFGRGYWLANQPNSARGG